MRLIPKPVPGDYPDYAIQYIRLLPDDGLVLDHLEQNASLVQAFIETLPEERLFSRYAPGKWSIKETLVHIVDDERIFAYRALAFARREKQALPGFDQDDYARWSGADARSLESIFGEYQAVRRATLALFNGLPETALSQKGTGSSKKLQWTVGALAYHIAGHELYHLDLIRTRYLHEIR